MSSRTIIRAAEWHLGVDASEGAPDGPIHEVQCTTCGETSGPAEDGRLASEVWALQHTGRHTDHRSFRALEMTFWRTTPAVGNPLAEEPGRG